MKLLKLPLALSAVLAISMFGSAGAQNLWIDFNSTTQDSGPHNEAGYQAYDAGHEVAADFITRDYAAFGTTVDFTPTWPDTTDNRVEQMIDRAAANDANWLGTKLDLVTDFIGIDTRTANGGNGDYDGTTGTPTRMVFTLGGVPAGEYTYRSYQHDTENVHAPFLLEYSTDAGGSFSLVGQFVMTNSSPNSIPEADQEYTGDGGQDPATLPSTVEFALTATGQDILLQYTPLSSTAVHTQILGVNGFELSLVPEPSCLGLALMGLLGLLSQARRRR